MLFRRFKFELYETDISDVEIAHDFFVPQPKLDTKGMRVKVTFANSWKWKDLKEAAYTDEHEIRCENFFVLME